MRETVQPPPDGVGAVKAQGIVSTAQTCRYLTSSFPTVKDFYKGFLCPLFGYAGSSPLPAKVLIHLGRGGNHSPLGQMGERPTQGNPMAKNKSKDTQVVYRDSKTGEFLTQGQAERKDPATWEREHIHHPKK